MHQTQPSLTSGIWLLLAFLNCTAAQTQASLTMLKTPQKSSQKFWIPFLHSSSLIFFFSFVSTLLLVLLQDIDVAYATDPAIFDDFEADLTSLLEVPDLDFSSSQDFPRATYRDSAFASTSAAAGKHLISTAGCMASFHVITAFHLTGNSQV